MAITLETLLAAIGCLRPSCATANTDAVSLLVTSATSVHSIPFGDLPTARVMVPPLVRMSLCALVGSAPIAAATVGWVVSMIAIAVSLVISASHRSWLSSAALCCDGDSLPIGISVASPIAKNFQNSKSAPFSLANLQAKHRQKPPEQVAREIPMPIREPAQRRLLQARKPRKLADGSPVAPNGVADSVG